MNINDETSITNTNNDKTSDSIYILAFQNMKELENISNFCQRILNETGNVQNSVLLYIKSDRNNEKKSNLTIANQNKIKMFCKNWNIPYLNDIVDIELKPKSSEKVLRFCVKYYWFLSFYSS